jgi:predicted transcriptional regulator
MVPQGGRAMAAKNERSLGALELDVLKAIWESPACTVAEVAERFPRGKYARTTVLTVVQRLHAKGLLKRRKEGGIFRYSATQPREQVLSRLITRFVENFLDGSPAPFVAYLTETKNITPEQKAVLEAMVRDIEKREG